MAADREWIEQIDDIVISVFAVAFLIACLIALGAVLWIVSQLAASTDQRYCRSIIGGDIRERMPRVAREMSSISSRGRWDRMLDRIEGLLDNLRQVSSDVAHDLRTPLSRLRTQLERSKHLDSDPSQIVEGAIAQLDHVLSFFAAILRIAEVEAGETRRYFTTSTFARLRPNSPRALRRRFKIRDVFYSSIESDLMSMGSELLAQAAINFIENAQRHRRLGR